jgi:hypothetical protein
MSGDIQPDRFLFICFFILKHLELTDTSRKKHQSVLDQLFYFRLINGNDERAKLGRTVHFIVQRGQ